MQWKKNPSLHICCDRTRPPLHESGISAFKETIADGQKNDMYSTDIPKSLKVGNWLSKINTDCQLIHLRRFLTCLNDL